MALRSLYDYQNGLNLNKGQAPAIITPTVPEVNETKIDTSDAINSLANALVTPEQRKEQEIAALKQKRNMAAWTGLADGLRQLANLYYTNKGATPQQYTDKPYEQIENNYQNTRAIQNSLLDQQDAYAKQVYAIRRQAEEDARKQAMNDAQVEYYKRRVRPDRLKGPFGNYYEYNEITGQWEEVIPENPTLKQKAENEAERAKKQGNAAVSNAATNRERLKIAASNPKTKKNNKNSGSLLPKASK